MAKLIYSITESDRLVFWISNYICPWRSRRDLLNARTKDITHRCSNYTRDSIDILYLVPVGNTSIRENCQLPNFSETSNSNNRGFAIARSSDTYVFR